MDGEMEGTRSWVQQIDLARTTILDFKKRHISETDPVEKKR